MISSIPNIVVLISGRGSNLGQLIIAAVDYKIAAVISDRTDAPGLEFARRNQIPYQSFNREDFATRGAQKAAILEAVQGYSPEFVALAGFMLIIQPEFIAAYPNRIINIHPSLLPKFPGLDTHNRALTAKETQHGCTVHVVDSGVDTGEIIAQAQCPIQGNDTEGSLAARVLKLEHQLYPWVMNGLAREEISINAGQISYSDKMRNAATEFRFQLNSGTVVH